MRHPKCPLCQENFIKIFDYIDSISDRKTIFDNLSIECCQSCGLSWTNRSLNVDDINEFYQKYYRSKASPHFFDYKNKELSLKIIDPRSYSQILLGIQYLSPKEKYNFLDIGAGPGYSFYCINNILDNPNLYLLENNIDAYNYFQRSLLDINVLNSLDEVEDKIDFVLMSHSLEHFDVDHIPILLRSLNQLLSPDGIVVIEVPHDDFRDNLRKDSGANHTPHLTFFSLESIENICRESDFKICYANTCSAIHLNSNKVDQKEKKTFRAGFLSLVRKVLTRLRVLNILSEIRWNFFPPKAYDFLASEDFRYGGSDRSCLRIVLQKKR